MGFIDVAIPAIGGLLLTLSPRLFVRASEDEQANAKRIKLLRMIGLGLLAIAALYLLIKVATTG